MTDFASRGDRPFALGVIRGERAFAVQRDGTLTGVMAQLPWLPGENVAQCASSYSTRMTIQLMGLGNTFPVDALSSLFPRGHCPHTGGKVATKHCSCGFYAYYDHEQEYAEDMDNIIGIIEAYGMVTYGRHGFRAGKAKIVALVGPQETRFSWLYSWIPRQLWPGLIPYCLIALANTALSSWLHVYSKSAANWISIFLMVFYISFVAAVLGNLLVSRKHRKNRRDRQRASAARWRKVKQKYPDVEIFSSMEEAQARYPLTDYTSLP